MLSSDFTNFISKYNLDAFTIEDILHKKNKNGELKKFPKGLPLDWGNCSKIDKSHKIGCIKTGKKSNISVIDFDDHKQYDLFYEEFPQLKNTLTIRTYKGYHCFYKYNPNVPCSSGCFKNYKNGIYNNLDGRNDGNFVFGVGSKYYHNGLKKEVSYDLYREYELLEFPDDILNKLCVGKVKNKNNNTNSNSPIKDKKFLNIKPTTIILIKDELEELGKLIRISDLDNYSDWVNIVLSIKSFGNEYKDFAEKLSRKSNKFDLDTFNKLWEYYDNTNCLFKFFYYARLGNKDEYYKIRAKYLDNIDSSDAGITEIALSLFGTLFIKENKEELKFFNGVNWTDDNYESKLNGLIKNDLVKFYEMKLDLLKKSTTLDLQQLSKDKKELENYGEDVKKLVKTLGHLELSILKCKSTKNQNDIRSQFKKDVYKNNIQWENKPYLFCFKDCVYDLKKGCFINPNPDDYLYMNCRYNYKPSKKEDREELLKILRLIFPVKEELDFYLKILASGLIGKTAEKFIISNGSGRNGKGLIHELAVFMLGDYAYEMVNTVLLKPLDTGTCPELANCENKRFVITKEPSENKQFELATIKDLTGGNVITARTHHSKKTQLNNRITLICECNNRPPINGRIDNSATARILDILFRSEFVDYEEDIDHDNYKYLKNTDYKGNEFKEKFKYALFDILKEYAKQYIKDNEKFLNIPDDIINRSREYMTDNDKLAEFIEEYLEKTGDNKDFITIKELLELYKSSEYYNRLNNREKQTIKLGSFKDNVKTNIILKDYFKIDRKKRNIISGWIIKN
jgi:phage/plasmid-associated DNA primase